MYVRAKKQTRPIFHHIFEAATCLTKLFWVDYCECEVWRSCIIVFHSMKLLIKCIMLLQLNCYTVCPLLLILNIAQQKENFTIQELVWKFLSCWERTFKLINLSTFSLLSHCQHNSRQEALGASSQMIPPLRKYYNSSISNGCTSFLIVTLNLQKRPTLKVRT